MDDRTARDELIEGLILWGVHQGEPAPLIDAASRAVADESSEPWILAVACLLPGASSLALEDVIAAEQPDLPVPLLPRGNVEVQGLAMIVMARRLLSGQLSSRQLTRWAHATFDHEDAHSDVQTFMLLDHEYDKWEHGAEVDREVLAAAIELVDRAG